MDSITHLFFGGVIAAAIAETTSPRRTACGHGAEHAADLDVFR